MKRNLVRFMTVITLISMVSVGGAAPNEDTPSDGPELVLVLSGGGARGAAHIGVLRILEEMHIAPDLIIGTSMGSIVGGLYAAGWSPDEIEDLLKSIDWDAVFTDQVPRSDLSFRRKQDDRPFLIDARLHLDEDGFYLPPGVLSGQSLEILLQTLEARSRPERDFDRLPVPFRAIATDIDTGKPVILDSGSLARAMRTSMSIPGLFPPVIIDGRTLIDGGSVANLPVGIALDFGAKRIIAVDISSPLTTPDSKLKSFLDVYNRLNALLTVSNRRTDVLKLRPQDILIRPDLKDISFLEFDRAEETVGLGEAAARDAADRLAGLSADPARWRAFIERQRRPPGELIHVDSIRMEGGAQIQRSVAAQALGITPPVDLTPDEIRQDIMRLFHLRHSGIISFRMDDVDGKQEMIIDAPPPPYGRHSFQLGLGLYDDFEGSGLYTITIRHQMLPANRHDGEWLNLLRLGSDSRLFSEFYQPLGPKLRWFVAPSLMISREHFDIWYEGAPIAGYQLDYYGARVGAGRVIGNQNEIRLSAFISKSSIDLRVGDPVFPSFSEDQGGLELRFHRDTEDSVMYPRQGGQMLFSLTQTFEGMGADYDQTRFIGRVSHAWSFGEFTLAPYVEYGEDGEPAENFTDFFFLGGPGRLSGLGNRELYGDRVFLARLGAYQRLKRIDIAGIRIRLYAGLSLELGNTLYLDEPMTVDSMMYGGTVFVGAATPVGPLYLGWGYTEGGRNRWYFALGDSF